MKKLTEQEMALLAQRAEAEGRNRAYDCTPTPMLVRQHSNMLDDNSPVVKEYAPVMGGVCGFAWVNIKPGTSRFARWLKKSGLARTDNYDGGVTMFIHEYGQSYELKQAHAHGMANYLREQGPTVKSGAMKYALRNYLSGL
jgi:hypothetical protein